MAETARKSGVVPGENEPTQQWVTISKASIEAKCSRLTLAQAALKGELVTDERAGFWFVERQSLDAFIARRKAEATKKVRARR